MIFLFFFFFHFPVVSVAFKTRLDRVRGRFSSGRHVDELNTNGFPSGFFAFQNAILFGCCRAA